MKVILKGLEGVVTPTIKLVKELVRPFMTDDFYYRFSKFHPGVSKEQIELKYDQAPIYEAPYNNFSVSTPLLKVPYGTAAFYSEPSDELQKHKSDIYFRLAKLKNDPDRILYALFIKNAINTNRGTITFDNSEPYKEGTKNAMSHEVRHMYDHEIEGLSQIEKQFLLRAYPDLELNGADWEKEATSTNTELRNHISRKYNGALKKDLDKAIDNIPDLELYNMYYELNGYTNDSDYYKKKNKSGLMELDPDKILLIRNALKNVAYNPSTNKINYAKSGTKLIRRKFNL